MLTKNEILNLIVGLQQANDLELLNGNSPVLTADVCYREDIPLIQAMGTIVDELMTGFDYSHSPQFEEFVAGKSEAYRQARLRQLSPVRRTEWKAQLADSLTQVLVSEEVLELVPVSHHPKIHELRSLLGRLRNAEN